jgi:LmbE family N-acetylglucosaminyl deacetylase
MIPHRQSDPSPRNRRASLEARLAANETISEPVAVVVAHPDDETLSLGSRLRKLKRLTLIHITDGAPRDLEDAHREGFRTWPQYAAARRRELHCALQAAGARPAQCIAHGYADKESVQYLVSMTKRMIVELAAMRAVLTHPYEHGHPDHDAAAFAVHAACALLQRSGARAPLIVEFASYHLRNGPRNGELARGVFWPDSRRREWTATSSAATLARRSRALDCFVTQRHVLNEIAFAQERVRLAPAYDFAQPAPPGAALYDRYGWSLTSKVWRARAREALQALELKGAI